MTQLSLYLAACQTPRVVCKRGRVYSTRRLDPPPPLELVPAHVVTLFERLFDRAPTNGELAMASEASTATPAQLTLLRRYGLVAPKPRVTLEARRAYLRAYERTRVRPDRCQYQREWFQRKRGTDPAWYQRHLVKKQLSGTTPKLGKVVTNGDLPH
jgi:hypothetical protein